MFEKSVYIDKKQKTYNKKMYTNIFESHYQGL